MNIVATVEAEVASNRPGRVQRFSLSQPVEHNFGDPNRARLFYWASVPRQHRAALGRTHDVHVIVVLANTIKEI